MADFAGVPVVAVGGVDERDPGVQGGVDGGDGPLFVRAVLDGQGHGAQADGAHGRVSDGAVPHGVSVSQEVGEAVAARASATVPGSQSAMWEKANPSSFARALLME